MEVNDYVAVLEQDGHLLLSAAQSADLASPVPSCPGWVLRDLLAHIGFVHRWAASYIEADEPLPPDEGPDEAGVLAGAPPDTELLPWVAEGHASLVSALLAAPEDLQCWTFLAAPSPLAFWARRQAHETAIHRVDAELTAGARPSPVEMAFAADGIDELLLGFLARSSSKRATDVSPGVVTFEATDTGASWTTTISSTGIETKPGSGPSDLTVRVPAEDLYLLLWNRPTRGTPDLDGRAGLLDGWKRLSSVTWS